HSQESFRLSSRHQAFPASSSLPRRVGKIAVRFTDRACLTIAKATGEMTMRVQTFSILAGSAACNARCPFCVSKMTPPHGMTLKEPEVNWRNFRKACWLAKQWGATTAMITGKGEPTLFPAQITRYLDQLQEHHFPVIELQTNGALLADDSERFLEAWYERGLN